MCNNKIGSTSIFLVVAVASVLLIAITLIRAAELAAGRSYGDAVFLMAGRSTLSEFDRRLLDDYGILGMRGDENTIGDKLTYYSDASLKRSSGILSGGVWKLPCDTRDIDVDLKGYSLLDINNFEKQIFDDIKNILVNNLADTLIPVKNNKDDKTKSSENRKIRNKSVLGSLPSKGLSTCILPIATIISQGLPSLEDLRDGVSSTFLTTEYALARFAAANTTIPKLAKGHDRFFSNEIEYLLIGKSDDNANYDEVITRLSLLRFALNEFTLHTDKEMIIEVNSVTSIIVTAIPPGPWTPFIRELVIAAWCAIEAANDIKLLEGGEKVPLYKNSEDWATSADSVISAVFTHISSGIEPGTMAGIEEQAISDVKGKSAVKPEKSIGFAYIDYLRLFMYFTPRDEKLLRMMDLIQINMKISYNPDFLIREHYSGFRYQVEMNEDIYNYEQKYRKDY